MNSFLIPDRLLEIRETYPDAKSFRDIASSGDKKLRCFLARLWLTEGIPYAFKNAPGLYEVVRDWISTEINKKLKEFGQEENIINPKYISLTGSGRLGQSLTPEKLGKEFKENSSDLDLFIVSRPLFEIIKDEFYKWSEDYKNNIITPEELKCSKRHWDDNSLRCPNNINKGFLNSNRIPNHHRYKYTFHINKILKKLISNLLETDEAPKIEKSSIRYYRSWDDCINQISLNLRQ